MKNRLSPPVLWAIVFALYVYGFGTNTRNIEVDTLRFRLKARDDTFVLFENGLKHQFEINKEWLIPEKEKEKYDGTYVSPFVFDSMVQSFPVTDSLTAIHLSSYTMLGRGSAGAAMGKDLFLIKKGNKLLPGLINLEITKSRVRQQGCFQSNMTHFVIGDINRDNVPDLGAIREGTTCSKSAEGMVFYQKDIQWYVFQNDGWKHDGNLDGKTLESYTELPLIGIALSPVDYVGQVMWRSLNPGKWNTVVTNRQLYNPAYRRKLFSSPKAD